MLRLDEGVHLPYPKAVYFLYVKNNPPDLQKGGDLVTIELCYGVTPAITMCVICGDIGIIFLLEYIAV